MFNFMRQGFAIMNVHHRRLKLLTLHLKIWVFRHIRQPYPSPPPARGPNFFSVVLGSRGSETCFKPKKILGEKFFLDLEIFSDFFFQFFFHFFFEKPTKPNLTKPNSRPQRAKRREAI